MYAYVGVAFMPLAPEQSTSSVTFIRIYIFTTSANIFASTCVGVCI